MRLRWTFRARADLLEIGRFIARDDLRAARALVAKLRTRANGAARLPRAGRRVPEANRDDIREVIEGNYCIVYRIAKRAVVVLTVFEGHRQFRVGDVAEGDEVPGLDPGKSR